MIVVATTEAELGEVQARLNDLGLTRVEVRAPSPSRRLMLAAGADEGDEERLASALRDDGLAAVARPDAGPRRAAWERDTEPLTIGGRLTISVVWSEHDRHDRPGLVELGPGGFGNGQHPTTRFLLDELVDKLRGGERVLDVGCGSGVLGLAALELGAASAVAVDLKPAAVEATRRNARLNGVADRLEATLAPLSALAGAFDVIVANVARAAIVELARDLVRLLGSDGWLGVSGISPSQCAEVADFLHPLTEQARRTSGDWASSVLVRAG